jgi:hypothetical protein
MKTTGNTMVTNIFTGLHYEDVPVMVKGKATKRTKRVIVYEYNDVVLTGIEVEGHEVFINLNDEEGDDAVCYKADGKKLTAMCKFGWSGTADHEEVVFYSKKQNNLFVHSKGYDGATWRGYGCRIKRFNW